MYIKEIIRILDREIERRKTKYLSAVEAATILDEAGILKDRPARPGAPLRVLLRDGKIPYAYQNGGSGSEWRIPHSSSANEIKTVDRDEIRTTSNPRQEPAITLLKSPSCRMQKTNKIAKQAKSVFLPDVLEPNLKVVFCGTAVGEQSALRGAYYAGPGNQFWSILAETGLTPFRLYPEQYPSLIQYRIGLTDLVKGRSGQDVTLSDHDFDVDGFKAKIEKYAPKAVGFNGKKAAKLFFASPSLLYGLQKGRIGNTALFVLPSTSGAARGFWEPNFWHELATFVK